MRFDLNTAKRFLEEWDAQTDGLRANRAAVAEAWNYNRSHAYDVARKCRAIVASSTEGADRPTTTGAPSGA